VIDSKNQEIRPDDDQIYSKMEDVADELPESSPRFILLSYPLTLVRIRSSLLVYGMSILILARRDLVGSQSPTSSYTTSPRIVTLRFECSMPGQWN